MMSVGCVKNKYLANEQQIPGWMWHSQLVFCKDKRKGACRAETRVQEAEDRKRKTARAQWRALG